MDNERLQLINVDGILCEKSVAAFMAYYLKELENFQFKQGDIFVAAYRKCGTTWMQYIVLGILNKGAVPPDINGLLSANLNHNSKMSETTSHGKEDMKRREPFKTHLPYNRVQKSPNAKYIYVVRNPFDCCISYYHYTLGWNLQLQDLTLDEFFEYFMEGNVPFGDYFDHVLGWYKHKDEENVIFLSYEDMIKDHRGTILKVAKFLGEKYYEELYQNEDMLDKIEHHSSFSFMKSLSQLRVPKDKATLKLFSAGLGTKEMFNDDEKFRTVTFFRSGIVGDFEAKLNNKQKERLLTKMTEKFAGTNLLRYWAGLF